MRERIASIFVGMVYLRGGAGEGQSPSQADSYSRQHSCLRSPDNAGSVTKPGKAQHGYGVGMQWQQRVAAGIQEKIPRAADAAAEDNDLRRKNRIQRYGLKTHRFPGKPGHFHQKS